MSSWYTIQEWPEVVSSWYTTIVTRGSAQMIHYNSDHIVSCWYTTSGECPVGTSHMCPVRLTCCVDRAGLSCPLRGRRPNSRRRTTWSATWCWPTPRVHLEHVSDNNTTTATTTLGVDPLPGFTWNMSVTTTRLQQQQHLVLTHSQGSPGTCQWQQHDYSNNNTWCWPTPRVHLEHVSDDNTTTTTTTLGVDPLPGFTWNMSVTTTRLQQQQHLVLTHSQGSPGTCQWQQHDYSNNNTWCWPTPRYYTGLGICLLQYYTGLVSACYSITQGWYLPAPVLHRAGICLLHYYTGLVSACYSITQSWYLPNPVLHTAGICLIQYYTGPVSACSSITQSWYLLAPVLHRAGICLLQYFTGLVSACSSITQSLYLPAPVLHRAGICLLQYYTELVSACSSII